MNQQTLMAALCAYPAPKASDELLWQVLNQAWRNAAPVSQVRERSEDESSAQSMMSMKTEKMLLITRRSWAMQ
jgi:hypothetical protein